MGKYRESIGLGDKYLFSTEMEFVSVYLEHLIEIFKKENLPVQLLFNHKSKDIAWDKWVLDREPILSICRKKTLGGELSSRILRDRKEIWQELKSICGVLKIVGAKADSLCSNHIRIDLSSISDERYFFNILSKVIALYEMDINFFYMGDQYLVRKDNDTYARGLSSYLLHYIHTVDFLSDPDFYYRFRRYDGMTLFTRRDGINLQDYLEKKLIEIRYANGSIEEKTIQNNLNFSLKLIDAIDKRLFDVEYLTKQIKDFDCGDFFMRYVKEEPCYEEFEQLVKTISTSSEDVNDFMSQYEHVLATKH